MQTSTILLPALAASSCQFQTPLVHGHVQLPVPVLQSLLSIFTGHQRCKVLTSRKKTTVKKCPAHICSFGQKIMQNGKGIVSFKTWFSSGGPVAYDHFTGTRYLTVPVFGTWQA